MFILLLRKNGVQLQKKKKTFDGEEWAWISKNLHSSVDLAQWDLGSIFMSQSHCAESTAERGWRQRRINTNIYFAAVVQLHSHCLLVTQSHCHVRMEIIRAGYTKVLNMFKTFVLTCRSYMHEKNTVQTDCHCYFHCQNGLERPGMIPWTNSNGQFVLVRQ